MSCASTRARDATSVAAVVALVFALRSACPAWATDDSPAGSAVGATVAQTALPSSGPSLVPSTGPAPAGPDDDGPPPSELTLKPYGIASLDATFEGHAKVQDGHAGLTAEYSLPLAPRLGMDLSVTGEYSHYDFTHAAGVLAVDKFTMDGYALLVQPGLGYALTDQLILLGGPFIQSTGQFGSDTGKSITYGGFGGTSYQINDKLNVTLGVAVSSRLSRSAQVLPFGGVNWAITDDLKLTGEATDFGGTFRLSRRLTSSVTASLLAGYAQREFRLRDDGPFPGGVLREGYVPVGAELSWTPKPGEAGPTLRADAGASAIDDIRFDDRSGNKIARHGAHPAPFFGLSASWKF